MCIRDSTQTVVGLITILQVHDCPTHGSVINNKYHLTNTAQVHATNYRSANIITTYTRTTTQLYFAPPRGTGLTLRFRNALSYFACVV